MSLTIFLDLVFGIGLCLGLGIGPGKRLGVGETLFGGDLGDKKNMGRGTLLEQGYA